MYNSVARWVNRSRKTREILDFKAVFISSWICQLYIAHDSLKVFLFFFFNELHEGSRINYCCQLNVDLRELYSYTYHLFILQNKSIYGFLLR